jgi:hypothetical protein
MYLNNGLLFTSLQYLSSIHVARIALELLPIPNAARRFFDFSICRHGRIFQIYKADHFWVSPLLCPQRRLSRFGERY